MRLFADLPKNRDVYFNFGKYEEYLTVFIKYKQIKIYSRIINTNIKLDYNILYAEKQNLPILKGVKTK